MMKSNFQINQERQRKRKEKFKWMLGWTLISLIMIGGIFYLIWIDNLS